MDDLDLINSIWDYSEPEETREKFTRYLIDNKPSEDLKHQILTQIIRTYSLIREFEKGFELCDELERDLSPDSTSFLRFNLEKGRLYNSSNDTENALDYFHRAVDLGKKLNQEVLTVDALHMVAIADQVNSLKLNEDTIDYAEKCSDIRARGWLGSLYNNTGWSYHDLKEYDKALYLFEKAYEFFKTKESTDQTRIAKWTIARVYRDLKRIDEAFKLQYEVLAELKSTDSTDGFCHEELGELFLIEGKSEEAKPHFKIAFEELSKMGWIENERLDRLGTLY